VVEHEVKPIRSLSKGAGRDGWGNEHGQKSKAQCKYGDELDETVRFAHVDDLLSIGR
jgi:hypothetical protein